MNLAQQKSLVRQFLERCNDYADDKIAGYAANLAAADPVESKSLQQKIGEWRSYRRFNEHTIGELASERLDAWFEAFDRR